MIRVPLRAVWLVLAALLAGVLAWSWQRGALGWALLGFVYGLAVPWVLTVAAYWALGYWPWERRR